MTTLQLNFADRLKFADCGDDTTREDLGLPSASAVDGP